jgi:hypothetical protein
MTITGTFNEGQLWEDWPDHPAEIHQDHKLWVFLSDPKPCRHAHSPEEVPPKDGWSSGRRWWIIPRVLVAYNEGGYCSTGVCLDCLERELGESKGD